MQSKLHQNHEHLHMYSYIIISAGFHKANYCIKHFVFLGVEYKKLMEGFGEEFFCLCFERYGSVLSALGCTLPEFYSNLNGLYEHILSLGIVVGGQVGT